MENKIELKPAFAVLGIMKRGKDGKKFIPPLWEKFSKQYHEKTRNLRKSNVGYGVMTNYDPQTKEFDYLAGVEVNPDTKAPKGMTIWNIPDQTYVKITCTVPTIMKAVEFFQKQWLPNQGYQPVEGPEFEYYPEEYQNVETDTMYMYFPIKKA
ncbi:MAG: GyrI-like domain-containing protein [Candidatus Bathyarchaeota archaeon]|jgi:predicted transcriptional regulator YdeE